MDYIQDFLKEFGNFIFDEHLAFLCAFEKDYENFDENIPCSHDDDSGGDVVGMCRCYYFHMKKERVIKIIEKYKSLLQPLLSLAANKKDKK